MNPSPVIILKLEAPWLNLRVSRGLHSIVEHRADTEVAEAQSLLGFPLLGAVMGFYGMLVYMLSGTNGCKVYVLCIVAPE